MKVQIYFIVQILYSVDLSAKPGPGNLDLETWTWKPGPGTLSGSHLFRSHLFRSQFIPFPVYSVPSCSCRCCLSKRYIIWAAAAAEACKTRE